MFKHIETLMLKSYNKVCCPTAVVRTELQRVLRRSDIEICGNATGIDCSEDPDDSAHQLISTRYCLSVGTIEPRKNFEKLIEVSSDFLNSGLIFVVAGRPGWGKSVELLASKAQESGGNFIWLQDASDRQLLWLYRHCELYLAPSHAEGFNMPLVEAASLGSRVLCSDIDIHREVAPPWAHFFDLSSDSDNLSKLIREILASPKPLLNAAKNYQSRYTWTSVATCIERFANE